MSHARKVPIIGGHLPVEIEFMGGERSCVRSFAEADSFGEDDRDVPTRVLLDDDPIPS